MIFIEKKLNTKYEYKTEDVFGKLTIVSPVKLDAKLLDQLVLVALNKGQKNIIINETIEITYERNNEWQDNEGEINNSL